MDADEVKTPQDQPEIVDAPIHAEEVPPHHSPKVHPALYVLILCLLVAAVSYHFGFERGKEQRQEKVDAKGPTPQVSPSPKQHVAKTSDDLNWKTHTIQIHKETAISGKEEINLSLQLPDGWTLETIPTVSNPTDLIKNCADYIALSEDGLSELKIRPICSGWSATYSDWPEDAVILSEEKNMGVDGHTTYSVRYYNEKTKEYIYVDGEKGVKDVISDAMIVSYDQAQGKFIPVEIDLFQAVEHKESTLKIADLIVATLKAQ